MANIIICKQPLAQDKTHFTYFMHVVWHLLLHYLTLLITSVPKVKLSYTVVGVNAH